MEDVHRVTTAAAFLLVLGLGAAACGTSSPGAAPTTAPTHPGRHAAPRDIVLASVDTTEALDTATVDIGVSVSGTPSFGAGLQDATGTTAAAVNVTITGHGAFDFKTKSGQMTITVPATEGSTGGSVEMRLVGNDLYLRAPQIAALDGGKPWVHVSVQDYQQKQGQSSGPLEGFSDGDPTQILGMLKQISNDVVVVGTANIDGVPTTEYQGSIDLTGGSGSTTGSTAISQQMATALGLGSIPIDVWIDSQGRARQVKTSFDLLGLVVAAHETLGSFGTPVTVSAPPPADVADGSRLLQSGKLGSLFDTSGSATSGSATGGTGNSG